MSIGADQPIFSIGAVAKMLSVPAATLRAWEERYQVVVPHRSEGAQRLYSRIQIEQLRFVQESLESGMSAADAHRVLQDEIDSGRIAGVRAVPTEPPPPLVLIAERDPYAAELAEYLLRTEGYDVCVALDAIQATLLFNERSPTLVVIDLLMSGGAGFRLCREFSSAGDGQILAVSALDSAGEALAAGAAAFLQKPLEPLQLLSVVRDLLGTSVLARPAATMAQPV
ncbi:MAG TPA: MerR family transcriptional regulator [Candidatus Dormibacteraeota bacterium]|nr:MerR family transcriptional regulator [Candidatus Dormibacteraeota bacterium]